MITNFENGIFGLLPSDAWLQVGRDVTRPNDPVDQLIGDIQTTNLVAMWETMAAEYNLPEIAMFHAFDTEAQKGIRIPVDVRNVEKGLIKDKIDQSERLQALRDRGVNNESEFVRKVFNDGYNEAEKVFTRSKVAKNELLATGRVTINENNLALTVDYGVPEDHLNLTLDFGAGASAPLDEQLLELKEKSNADGAPISGMYLSEAALNKFRKNTAIQKAVNGNGMVGQLVRNADFADYLRQEFGISRILTNDLNYSTPRTMGNDGRPQTHAHRYYPVNRVSFFSGSEKIGDGIWGLPPEARAAQFTDAIESGDFPYVFITQWAEHDPAVVWTKASGLFMPVLYNPSSLYVATVKETAGA